MTPGPGTLFLGLDVGTQGTKGVVVDTGEGRVAARAAHGYGLLEGLPPGAAEQHPDTWWDAVRRVVAALGETVDLAAIAGVGVSGQQHGFVPLDADDRVLRPAKLWCDTATAEEAGELSRALGRPVPTGFTASKILWLQRHEPDTYARLARVLLPHDWINLQLTGVAWMEAGDASGTGLFDPRRRAFDADALAAVDPRLAGMLPALVAPDRPAAAVHHDAAAALGLREGTPVAPGGGDNMMSAIGAGAVEPGVSVLSLGTSGTVFARSDAPLVDPEGLIAPFCDSAGGWLPLLCVMNLTCVAEEVTALTGQDHAALTAAAERVAPGSEGLLWLPYLVGERVPDLPHATGALLGLRPGSLRPATLYRAALEGPALNLALGLARMRALGLAVDRVRLVGGGARNALWRQIFADAFAVPVQALAEPESAALGAALQAAWCVRGAAGELVSLADVVAPFIAPEGPAAMPDAESVARYRQLAARLATATERLFGSP